MTLINCPECKKEISDSATSCPHCGKGLKEVNPTIIQLDQAPDKRRRYKIQYLIFAPLFFVSFLFFIGNVTSGEDGKAMIWFLLALIGLIGMIYSKIKYWLNKP